MYEYQASERVYVSRLVTKKAIRRFFRLKSDVSDVFMFFCLTHTHTNSIRVVHNTHTQILSSCTGFI